MTAPRQRNRRARQRVRLAGGIPLGRPAGIPIMLSWSWLLSVVIIVVVAAPVVQQVVPGTSRGTGSWVAALLGVLLGACVLIHEFGHCVAARVLGLPVTSVRLYLLGGVSELGRLPSSAREEAVIAGAGPLLSVILSGLFVLLLGSVPAHTIGWLLLIELAFANGIVAVFNLLPALPLDGGRMLRAGIWRAFGRRRWGTVAGAIGGYLIALALLIWAIVELTGSGKADVLEGVVALATAVFVAFGAAVEQRSEASVKWPAGLALTSVARPVVQLPKEIPVELALRAAAGRAVVLTGTDGITAGVLDERAAIGAARTDPRLPAEAFASPIRPELVVLPGEHPSDIAARLGGALTGDLVLIGDDGSPVGVVPAAAWSRILAGQLPVSVTR